MSSLSAQSLSVRLPSAGGLLPILEDISFEIRREEIVCIIGPSGCGKTTLLRTLAGFQAPSSGRVDFGGTAVSGPRPDLAFVFQDYGRALLPWRTVAGNVELALEARHVPPSKRAGCVAGLLKQVGLERYADHFPKQLSGGMQQRVQIARCLALEPAALLMDEPFGALDAMTRQVLQDELMRLATANRMTVAFITHDLEEAIYLGDRVITLAARPGRIAEIVDIDLPRPRDPLATREDPRFGAHRHHLFEMLRELS